MLKKVLKKGDLKRRKKRCGKAHSAAEKGETVGDPFKEY